MRLAWLNQPHSFISSSKCRPTPYIAEYLHLKVLFLERMKRHQKSVYRQGSCFEWQVPFLLSLKEHFLGSHWLFRQVRVALTSWPLDLMARTHLDTQAISHWNSFALTVEFSNQYAFFFLYCSHHLYFRNASFEIFKNWISGKKISQLEKSHTCREKYLCHLSLNWSPTVFV